MTSPTDAALSVPVRPPLGFALSIDLGCALHRRRHLLGRFVPAPFHALGHAPVAEVNIPVAILVWLMITPMLLKIDFRALHQVRDSVPIEVPVMRSVVAVALRNAPMV
jgi:ACR3 family arsenite efflux pump ArsB